MVTTPLPNPQRQRWSGAAVAASHLETVYGYACAQKLAAFCAIFVAKRTTLPVLGIDVIQSAGAAHRYPGLFDINGKKLANAQFKQWLEDGHLHLVINYRFSNGQFFERGRARLGRDMGLISAWLLCFDRSVLAKDDGGSLSTVAPTTVRQNEAVTFATTHWSLVLTAQGESPAAREALEKLCRTYWRPLYAFVRQQGYKHEEAEDLTQSFFALLLERRDFDALRAEKGKLRSYLLVSLKHFLSDERQRGMALKRGKGQPLIPLEDLRTFAQADFEPSNPETAEWIYERRWALTLLDTVFGQLADEYRKANKAALFDWLKQLLPDEPGAPSQAEIALNMGMTENTINQAFYRFRHRYQTLLREEIAHTVAVPKDVEDELRHLISVLRA